MRINRIDHQSLVKDNKCIHVERDRSLCLAPTIKGMHHSWLCWFHFSKVHNVPVDNLGG